MEKKSITKEIIIVFWLFIIGSTLGYICETIVGLLQDGVLASRKGLIYGPFTPVYGLGIVIYYLVLSNINTKNKIKVFFITAILGATIEYTCSLLQEKIFGTISWDYSNHIFNINGRTSLLYCSFWGIAGVLYVIYIDPFIEKLKPKIDQKSVKIITVIFAILMILDITISFIAAERQTERRNNIAPQNKLDLFLDKHYPDQYMDKIYSNKKEVKI